MATQESIAYAGDDITTERDLFWAAIKQEVDVTVSNRTEYVGFESVLVKEEPGVEDEMRTVRDAPSGFDVPLPPVEMVLVDAVAVKTEPNEGPWGPLQPESPREEDPLLLPEADLKREVKEELTSVIPSTASSCVKKEPNGGDDPLRLNSDACQWDVTTGTDPPQIPGHQKWDGDTSSTNRSNATAVKLEAGEQSLVDERFECAVCSAGFAKKSHLRRHIKAHDDRPVDEFEFVTCRNGIKEERTAVGGDPAADRGEASSGPPARRKHRRSLIRPRFACPECGATFERQWLLSCHGLSHSGRRPRPFACDVPACGKAFADRWHLRCHALTHCARRPFACDAPACGKTFKGKSNLTRHRLTHADDRPHACPVAGCGKRFKYRNNLSAHERTHSESRPFECAKPSCGKRFRSMGNLTLHLQTHDGGRIHKCGVEDCGKQYRKKGDLARHRDSHCGRTAWSVASCGVK